ncbi:hypothetical protein D3C71_1519500 [compost metagenome]
MLSEPVQRILRLAVAAHGFHISHQQPLTLGWKSISFHGIQAFIDFLRQIQKIPVGAVKSRVQIEMQALHQPGNGFLHITARQINPALFVHQPGHSLQLIALYASAKAEHLYDILHGQRIHEPGVEPEMLVHQLIDFP